MDVKDCKDKYDTTIIERLNNHGLINKDSLIVHGVYISDKELDIVKKQGAYMVVNTTSNLNNAVGITDIKKFIKGLMIESYLEDGSQMIGNGIFGKSITDPCLGWEKTEKLLLEIADIYNF